MTDKTKEGLNEDIRLLKKRINEFEAGYFIKPFESEELLAKMKELIG